MCMEFCRLCQAKLGSHSLLNEGDLCNKILECTGIDVSDNNKYPNKICPTCKVIIDTFHDFLVLVRKVDKDIRKSFRASIETPDISKCTHCQKTISQEVRLEHHRNHKTLCGVKFETELEPKDLKDEKVPISNTTPETLPYGPDFETDDKNQLVSFKCTWDNCNKVCRSAYTLRTHEMSHTGKWPFLCVTCGKGFMTKHSIISHEKIHLEVKNYKCKACNIGFSVRSNLRAHERKHHEGVRFYCSQCTRQFITKSSLERHERLHTGVKEFKCQLCPSAFYTNKELVKHQRYHQGLKQHKCDQCFKSFFEKHHLTIHMRSHSGERPYVCKIPGCNKSFTESQKLTRHQKSKHANS